MTIDVTFPHLSEDVDEGVLVTWFVEPGARVAEGDLIASVQVEKVEQEVYAPGAGSVVELLAAPGDVVAQGAVIARLGEPAETTATPSAPATSETTAAAPRPAAIIASPAAKRLARELGVDLANVKGTGPGGRIVEADVRQAASVGGNGQAAAAEPLDVSRRLMATRLRDWLATTAQFTLTTEVDVTALAAQRPPWAAAVVWAAARSLKRHPKLTQRWQGDQLVRVESIDIGVAVSLDDGLIVPVVRRADERDLSALASEIADLSDRARRSALRVDEVTGGAFTVTSLGAYPIDVFTPLLQPPQIAILGVGRAREKPAVVEGRIEPRWLLVLSLTVDHRVIDGAPAAAFLTDVAAQLADPAELLAGYTS